MDPLSDILALLKPRGYMAGGIDAGGPWSLWFCAYECVRCFAVSSGQCWLAVDGVEKPLLLQAGDCVLLPHGVAFSLASDLTLEPVDVMTIITAPMQGRIATYNGGGDCLGVSAIFTFAASHTGLLLGALPPVVYLQRDSDKEALRWSLERVRQELVHPQPGGFMIAQHLAHMILLLALRFYMAEGRGVGWLFALADPPLCAAIQAIHADPSRAWTLQSLAERAGQSRSTFALRFKEMVGESPMEYLTRWRMLVAGERLVQTDDSIANIAVAVGYESESAFGAAFKRVMQCSPRRYASRKIP